VPHQAGEEAAQVAEQLRVDLLIEGMSIEARIALPAGPHPGGQRQTAVLHEPAYRATPAAHGVGEGAARGDPHRVQRLLAGRERRDRRAETARRGTGEGRAAERSGEKPRPAPAAYWRPAPRPGGNVREASRVSLAAKSLWRPSVEPSPDREVACRPATEARA